MADFITINTNVTTGALGALARIICIVSREAVAGFTPSATTGLYQINSSDVTTFIAANSSSPALCNALNTVFSQSNTPTHVYILSASSGVTSTELNTANINKRAWSFITLVSAGQGAGADETNYFTDLGVIGVWLTTADGSKKLCAHTYSTEEVSSAITLPAALDTDGAIISNNNIKTIVSNSNHDPDIYTKLYDNIALAWMTYNLYGSAVSRSWGSLSDSHDYAWVSTDTFGNAVRSQILNANLGQYNGAKDQAGSLFVYDTLMNDNTVPPDSLQMESIAAIKYIQDYVYVYVHNSLQAAGQTGLPNDDGGINAALGLAVQALNNCFDLNLILANAAGAADFVAWALTAAEVTVLSPTWKTSGVWPSGVITAQVVPYGAAHYVTINLNF